MPEPLPAEVWDELSCYEHVFFIRGTPTRKADLLRAGVDRAHAVCVFSPDTGQSARDYMSHHAALGLGSQLYRRHRLAKRGAQSSGGGIDSDCALLSRAERDDEDAEGSRDMFMLMANNACLGACHSATMRRRHGKLVAAVAQAEQQRVAISSAVYHSCVAGAREACFTLMEFDTHETVRVLDDSLHNEKKRQRQQLWALERKYLQHHYARMQEQGLPSPTQLSSEANNKKFGIKKQGSRRSGSPNTIGAGLDVGRDAVNGLGRIGEFGVSSLNKHGKQIGQHTLQHIGLGGIKERLDESRGDRLSAKKSTVSQTFACGGVCFSSFLDTAPLVSAYFNPDCCGVLHEMTSNDAGSAREGLQARVVQEPVLTKHVGKNYEKLVLHYIEREQAVPLALYRERGSCSGKDGSSASHWSSQSGDISRYVYTAPLPDTKVRATDRIIMLRVLGDDTAGVRAEGTA
jgi:hypothetical protein